jgi:hypothetical protein
MSKEIFELVETEGCALCCQTSSGGNQKPTTQTAAAE